MNNITPIKIGIKFNPASLILVYRDKTKLRSRQIPVKDVDILTEVYKYSENFKLDPKYRKYFDKIPVNRLAKLIFIIQDNMKGYTLEESLERSKKFNTNIDETSESTESNNQKLIKDYQANDDDDDDFHDTEDEDDKNVKSVSTIEEVKNKTKLTSTNTTTKTSDALNILQAQMNSIKTNLYDFEDDDNDDDEDEEEEENEDDDDDDTNKKEIKRNKLKKKESDDKIETAIDDLSDTSF
jgi:centrosomal protein CEP19